MNEKLENLAEEFKPAYLLIAEEIEKNIKDGIYKAGDRIPSKRALSLRYRVHRNSISPAFKLLKDAKLLEVKEGCGMIVAEKPIPKSIVAVIIPNGYYDSRALLDGVQEVCEKHAAEVKLLAYNSREEQDDLIASLSACKYTGAILYPKFSDESAKNLMLLTKTNEFPIVLAGRPDQAETPCWRVDRNELRAAYITTEHLLEQHFSRIGIVVSKHPYDVAFLNGYRQAMHEYEALIRDADIQYTDEEKIPGDATRNILSIEKRPVKAILYAHPP